MWHNVPNGVSLCHGSIVANFTRLTRFLTRAFRNSKQASDMPVYGSIVRVSGSERSSLYFSPISAVLIEIRREARNLLSPKSAFSFPFYIPSPLAVSLQVRNLEEYGISRRDESTRIIWMFLRA